MGFKWRKVARFQKAYGLNDDAFAQMVGMSPRSLARRRNEETPLDPVSSDRFYRISQIIDLATVVFNGKEPALRWLRRPQTGLNNMIPLEMLDTEPGSRAVQSLLTQIEHGVLP